MTPPLKRPDTVTREFILARCTGVQVVSPQQAKRIVEIWKFMSFVSESNLISERDKRAYRLIGEMFEARAKEAV